MDNRKTYRTKHFELSGLVGISDETLKMHFKLYEGYVKATNTLNDQISTLLRDGQIDQEEMPAYSELKRRLGFEYNGMILHEHYFENLTKDGGGDPNPRSVFHHVAASSFGGYQQWRSDFMGVGKMRGVGWAICYFDAVSNHLSNHWITLHETGNPAGYKPLLVMDMWEHAFLLDYKPVDRPKYIDAFFANIDWKTVEGRIDSHIKTRRSRVA